MKKKYKYWNHKYEPTKPYKPHLENNEFEIINSIISDFDVYVSLEDIIYHTNNPNYNIPKDAFDINYNIIAESHVENECSIYIQIEYKVPLSIKKIEAINKENNIRTERYNKELDLYKLQLLDWEEIKKEKTIIDKEERRKMYDNLKKEFGNE